MWCFQDKCWSIITPKYLLNMILKFKIKERFVRLSQGLMRMLKLIRFW